MYLFQWKNKNDVGFIHARDIAIAKMRLQKHGIEFIYIKKMNCFLNHYIQHQLKPALLIDVLNDLVSLLDAGIDLLSALNHIQHQEHLAKNYLVSKLIEHISQGYSLSQAIEKYPSLHHPYLLTFIKLSEASGSMAREISHALACRETLSQFFKKIKKALSYPFLLLISTVIVVIMLMLLVIPQFQNLYADNHAHLPALTSTLIMLAHCFSHYSFALLLGVAVTVFSLVMLYLKNVKARQKIDGYLMNLPIYRNKMFFEHFYFIASLLTAGLNITDCLQFLIKHQGNTYMQSVYANIEQAVKNGERINAAFDHQKIFPKTFISLIQIAEQTGNLDKCFKNIAHIAEKRLNKQLASVEKYAEPILTLIAGGLISFVLLAMYLPMISIGNIL